MESLANRTLSVSSLIIMTLEVNVDNCWNLAVNQSSSQCVYNPQRSVSSDGLKKTQCFKNDVLFMTWMSLRQGFPFLDIWGKRSQYHCCEIWTGLISPLYAFKVIHVLLDGGNYMENPRFTRVPRLKGESKATPQATNTLKITWEEPNRTCPTQ